jgi:hypothetical protein
MHQQSAVKERGKIGVWKLFRNLLRSFYYLHWCGITVTPCLLHIGKTSLLISGHYDF